jgi:flavoprotein
MKQIKKEYENTVEIQVFVSKAGETVLKYYGLETRLRQSFEKVQVEINANAPFLAAWLQMGKYEFLLKHYSSVISLSLSSGLPA